MKLGLLAVVGLLAVGCASGMPGSSVRAFYNLCVAEGGEEVYCEAWANVEGHKLSAGNVRGLVVMPIGSY